MNLHKHLIALFAEYDGLTKRVRAYPCDPGSARERVQVAIARQASLFMAKEAGVLQVRFVQLRCCLTSVLISLRPHDSFFRRSKSSGTSGPLHPSCREIQLPQALKWQSLYRPLRVSLTIRQRSCSNPCSSKRLSWKHSSRRPRRNANLKTP